MAEHRREYGTRGGCYAWPRRCLHADDLACMDSGADDVKPLLRHRLSYWLRPYDSHLDRRRWRWAKSGCQQSREWWAEHRHHYKLPTHKESPMPEPTTTLVASADAVDMPMPLHQLTMNDAGQPHWTCDAPFGSRCRLSCAEDCGAEQWPCNSYDDEGEEIKPAHPMEDSGGCHVVLYLEQGEPMESYEGDDLGPSGLRSGLVNVVWEGDYYGWTYAEGEERG